MNARDDARWTVDTITWQKAEIERLRAALDLIWHIAPLPTQSDLQRLRRVHNIARNALFHPENEIEHGLSPDHEQCEDK